MIDFDGLDSVLFLVSLITIPALVVFVYFTVKRHRFTSFRQKRSKPRSE